MYYSECPECGNQLHANVEQFRTKVPLRGDGVDLFEGMSMDTEITKTYCPICGWEEKGSHYYHTGEVTSPLDKVNNNQ